MAAESGTVYNTKINYTELNEADQILTIELATNALKNQEKSESPMYHKDIAKSIKQQLDQLKGGAWNVVVGTSFGSFVSHETKTKHFFSYLAAWLAAISLHHFVLLCIAQESEDILCYSSKKQQLPNPIDNLPESSSSSSFD